MRKTGLAEAYRRECDFMDWRDRAHPRRDRSVVHRGRAGRTRCCCGAIPSRRRCRSVFARACRRTRRWRRWRPRPAAPQIDDFDLSVRDRRCEKANLFAMQSIERLRPDLVDHRAERRAHRMTDWPALTARVLRARRRRTSSSSVRFRCGGRACPGFTPSITCRITPSTSPPASTPSSSRRSHGGGRAWPASRT